MARPIKSKARLNRIENGIDEQPKNPKSVQAGINSNISKMAKAKDISQKEAQRRYKAIKTLEVNRAVEVTAKTIRGVKSVINEQITVISNISQNNQQVVKTGVVKLFVESSQRVAKRLIDLSLGRDGFEDAPASVQRLAMIDVLTFAGISQQEAEKQAKPVHEMNSQELESLIAATEQHLQEVRDKQNIVTIDQTE